MTQYLQNLQQSCSKKKFTASNESMFSLSTMWVPGIKLRPPGLAANAFILSHRASPLVIIFREILAYA